MNRNLPDFVQSLLDITFWSATPKEKRAFIVQLAERHISRAVDADERLRPAELYAHDFLHLLQDYRVRPMTLSTRNAVFTVAESIIASEERRRRRAGDSHDAR